MAVGDVYRLSIEGAADGQLVVTTSHYRVLTAPDETLEATNLIVAWQALVQPNYIAAVSNQYQLRAVRARQEVLPPGVGRVAANEGLATAGGVAEDHHPNMVSIVLRKLTGLAGRRNRGRIYMPAVPISFITNSVLTIAGVGGYAALVDAMNDQIGAPPPLNPYTYEPVVFSRTASMVAPPMIRANTITQVTLNLAARSQRRREVGVGPAA